MNPLGSRRKPQRRFVDCTSCGGRIETTARAMSIFCPHCRKRVILEDFCIKGYHAEKQFATCGDVTVEKGGTLSAPVQVSRLTVKGQVWGDVNARECVEIGKSGLIKGVVRAPQLVVKDGGVIVGRCEIGLFRAPPPLVTEV
jgi:hypothetical protein